MQVSGVLIQQASQLACESGLSSRGIPSAQVQERFSTGHGAMGADKAGPSVTLVLHIGSK